MNKITTWLALTFLMVASLVLASCTAKTTSSATTMTTTTKTTATTTRTTTTNAVTTTPTTTTATGNWWTSLGTPEYGNTLTLQIAQDVTAWDPYQGEFYNMVWTAWLEQLYSDDWTMNPQEQPYQGSFVDASYIKGQLLSAWEFTDPSTLVMHVRPGVTWQNLPPANGRAFTAQDIVFHFDRMLGLGDGYTTPSQMWLGEEKWVTQVASVTATNDSTVVMKWNVASIEYISEIILTPGAATSIENPEAVKQWGDVTDWHHAVGTGPFILTDYISGSSVTMERNPSYWEMDERYPQNRLPYIDKLVYLIMPDESTALAALRSGKIDVLDNVSTSDVQSIKKTNPEILQITIPGGNVYTVDPRYDLKPFNDIKVREALQQSINLPELASTYYQGTVSPDPSTMTSNYLTGWGWPYDQWPQDLKDTYAYNLPNAKALLTAAGYSTGFNTDCVVSNDADVTLLQAVKGYFADINVNMTITTMDPAAWSSYVITNHKNDALAMRANGSLGFNYAPYFQFGHYAKGAASDYMMMDVPVLNNLLPDAMNAATTDEWKTILKNANMWVAQNHPVISLLQTNSFSEYQPWLKGFNAQYGATWGWGGPELLFFYDARFWIDSKIKASYEH